MKTSARWAIHSIICLLCAAAVAIGALAGLSGVWVGILCLVSVAFSVAAMVLVVLAVLVLTVEVGDWLSNRGSKMSEAYVYKDKNGTRCED